MIPAICLTALVLGCALIFVARLMVGPFDAARRFADPDLPLSPAEVVALTGFGLLLTATITGIIWIWGAFA